MHIPDGYLSPSTCATLYAVSTPFWYASLQRVKKRLNARAVPLLSVFAAFSFVIMMFNLPLPGGTTGHAVGMGMASIVLGPWISILALSTALLVQALLFGDGGITTFGANCFNMAIAGSLVAYGAYRLIAFKAALTSSRRVVAAGIAGYAAINVAALCAAIELGVQPLFFHDAFGAPIYAPYPLNVSIPAMMIGHLTFAGLGELIISAGIVAYLQRTSLNLLRTTAPDAPELVEAAPAVMPGNLWLVSRRLWIVLAVFLVLTPLGIVAAGNAWGEWHAKDFADAATRRQIAAVSGNHAPPEKIPGGLQRLSSLWKAPVSDYAPPFIRSARFGYFVSASMGVGTILLISLLGTWFMSRSRAAQSRRRKSFVERTTRHLFGVLEATLFAEETAHAKGLLQALDARVKLVGIIALILAAVASRRLWIVCLLFGLTLVLAALSHVPLRRLAVQVWIAVLGFTGVIAVPAIFLTPGPVAAHIPFVDWSITTNGLRSAAFLILRAETGATLMATLLLTTPWSRLLRGLRIFRIPATAVAIVEMTYRYIFVFVETARNMFESRETRLLGDLEPTEQRRLASSTAGVLLEKTFQLSAEVHMAMRARGFRGDVILLEDLRMKSADWIQLTALAGIASAAIWLGR